MTRNADMNDLSDVFRSTLRIKDHGDAPSAAAVPPSAAGSDSIPLLSLDLRERGPVRMKDKPKTKHFSPYKQASASSLASTNTCNLRLSVSDSSHEHFQTAAHVTTTPATLGGMGTPSYINNSPKLITQSGITTGSVCDSDFSNNPTISDFLNNEHDIFTYAAENINEEHNFFQEMEQDTDEEQTGPNVKPKEQHADKTSNQPTVYREAISAILKVQLSPATTNKTILGLTMLDLHSTDTSINRPSTQSVGEHVYVSLDDVPLPPAHMSTAACNPVPDMPSAPSCLDQYTHSKSTHAKNSYSDCPTSAPTSPCSNNRITLQTQINQQSLVQQKHIATQSGIQQIENKPNLVPNTSGYSLADAQQLRTNQEAHALPSDRSTGAHLQPLPSAQTISTSSTQATWTNTVCGQVLTQTSPSDRLTTTDQTTCVQTSTVAFQTAPVVLIPTGTNVTIFNVFLTESHAASPVKLRPIRPKESAEDIPRSSTPSRHIVHRTGSTPPPQRSNKKRAAETKVDSISAAEFATIDSDGDSRLHVAASMYVDPYYMTALVARVLNECLYLLDMGNNKGQTPLYIAVYLNLHENVKILVEKGADPNILVTTVGKKGNLERKAAIHVASTNTTSRASEANNARENSGASQLSPKEDRAGNDTRAGGSHDKRKPTDCTKTLKELLKSTKLDINIKNSLGQTALHCAILADPKNVQSTTHIQLLMEAKADLLATDTEGRTPLMFAVQHKLPGLVTLLVRDAKKKNLSKDLVLRKDLTGVSALDMASKMTDSVGVEIWNTLHGEL